MDLDDCAPQDEIGAAMQLAAPAAGR